MPTLKRRPAQQQASPLRLESLGPVDRLLIHLGPNEDGETLRTEADMLTLWKAHHKELSTMRTGPDDPLWLLHHAPGQRTWLHWRFELLPAHPRRRVVNEAGLRSITNRSPSLEPWSCDGWECSYLYLRCRGLLKAGEEDAIRATWPMDQVRRHLESHRGHVESYRRYTPEIPLPAHELAALLLLYDLDGSQGLLTPEERTRAAGAFDAAYLEGQELVSAAERKALAGVGGLIGGGP